MKIEANVNTHGNKRTSRVNNAISGEIFRGKLQTISQGKLSSQETTKSSFVHLITHVYHTNLFTAKGLYTHIQ